MNKITGFVLVALFVSTIAHAEKIFVEPTKGTGMEKADLDSTTSLIQSSVTQQGQQLVGKASDAEAILKPELLRLGKSYILKISEVKNGETVSSTQLKAESIEEMDKVSARVTEAVLKNKPAEETAQVNNITNQESHEGTQRRPVRTITYVGIGAALLSNMNTDGSIGYNLAAGAQWDNNSTMLKIIVDVSAAKGAALMALGLGGDYFLNENNIAPYVGGIFGYGSSKTAGSTTSLSSFSDVFGETISGFILSPEVGLQFMRTSQTSLDLSFHAEYLLRSNSIGSPAAYILRLGINF